MTLKDTVRNALLKYPIMYRNAFDVYHHLFCVNGNGYKWENGELVGKSDIPPISSVNEAIISYLKENLTDGFHIKLIKAAMKGNILEKHFNGVINGVENIMNIEEREKDFSAPKCETLNPRATFEFYPLCKHAKMVCFPDDIKEDWLEGIKKMVQLIDDNPHYATSEDREYVKLVKEKIENYG